MEILQASPVGLEPTTCSLEGSRSIQLSHEEIRIYCTVLSRPMLHLITMPAEFIIIVLLVVSVVLHEVAHGWCAYAYGDPTAKLAGRLSLNPIKHIDPIGSLLVPVFLVITMSSFLFGWAKPVPYNPYNLPSKGAEVMVAAAGCLTNIFFGVLFALCIRFGGDFFSTAMLEIFFLITVINFTLCAINLLPLPSLDGAKIIRPVPVIGRMFERFEQSVFKNLGFFGALVVVVVFLLLVITPLSNFILTLARAISGI